MKKFFGILFLVIGLVGVAIGIALLTNVQTRNNTFFGSLGNSFSDEYRTNTAELQAVSLTLIIGGMFFFVIGIIMVATKSNRQRKIEYEHDSLNKTYLSNNKKEASNSTQSKESINIDKIHQLERIAKLKENGMLNDQEFMEQKEGY